MSIKPTTQPQSSVKEFLKRANDQIHIDSLCQFQGNRLVHYSLTRWKVIFSFAILKQQHYNCYLQHLLASGYFIV